MTGLLSLQGNCYDWSRNCQFGDVLLRRCRRRTFVVSGRSSPDGRNGDECAGTIAECPKCAEAIRAICGNCAAAPGSAVRVPPHSLTDRLRVRLRGLRRHAGPRRRPSLTVGDSRTWLTDFRLWTENLMRPLAMPTAGGFASAVILFGSRCPSGYSPSLAIPMPAMIDVPTGLYTEASVKSICPVRISRRAICRGTHNRRSGPHC